MTTIMKTPHQVDCSDTVVIKGGSRIFQRGGPWRAL